MENILINYLIVILCSGVLVIVVRDVVHLLTRDGFLGKERLNEIQDILDTHGSFLTTDWGNFGIGYCLVVDHLHILKRKSLTSKYYVQDVGCVPRFSKLHYSIEKLMFKHTLEGNYRKYY